MNENSQNVRIKRYGTETVIQQLQPYVSKRRQQRIDQVLGNRLLSVQIALEMPADLLNAFAVIRSCEIFGVVNIHIIAPEKIESGMRTISKGAMDWVDIHFYPDINPFLQQMQQQNCRLAGAVLAGAQNVNAIPIEQPVCLLLGSEHSGLSNIAKKACDWHYHIPMFGMTESLNLSVAAGISLYETTHRKRIQLQQSGDLTQDAWKELQAKYYLNSVNDRLMNALFPL